MNTIGLRANMPVRLGGLKPNSQAISKYGKPQKGAYWFIGLCIAASGAPALAYDWSISAKVTMIELTYMPVSIDFSVDHAGGSCAVGSLLTWTPQGPDATSKAQNAQAILAALMTAKSSGQNVTLFGSNSGCQINFLYLQ